LIQLGGLRERRSWYQTWLRRSVLTSIARPYNETLRDRMLVEVVVRLAERADQSVAIPREEEVS